MDPIEKIYEAQIAIQRLLLELNVAEYVIDTYGVPLFLADHNLLDTIRLEARAVSAAMQVLTNANEQ
jgi:hypothetical protein